MAVVAFLFEEDGGEGGRRRSRRGTAGAGGFTRQLRDLLVKPAVLSFHAVEALHEEGVFTLHVLFLVFELFDLEAFSLARGLSGGAVSKHAFYPALFLLIVGLCPFSWWQVRLWDGQFLAPRLSLLDLFLVGLVIVLKRVHVVGKLERGLGGGDGERRAVVLVDGRERHGVVGAKGGG